GGADRAEEHGAEDQGSHHHGRTSRRMRCTWKRECELTQHATTPLGRRPERAETSILDFIVSRMTSSKHRLRRIRSRLIAASVLVAVWTSRAAGVDVAPGFAVDVLVSDVPRPVAAPLEESPHLVFLS